jgi:hypothetical protein
MATCAICLKTIVRGSKFVISVTEVLHRECALAGGRTVLNRLREEHLNLQSEIERERRTSNTWRENLTSQTRVLSDTERVLMDRLDRMTIERDDALAALAVAVASAQRDDARIASAREASPDTPRPVAIEPPPGPAGDDAEVRFSLLELDLV